MLPQVGPDPSTPTEAHWNAGDWLHARTFPQPGHFLTSFFWAVVG
jgi:hypothetical protein